MPKAHSTELRWMVVLAIWDEGLDPAQVAHKFSSSVLVITARWVTDLWRRYLDTGDVESWQGHREAPPSNTIMTVENAQVLVNILLDSPEHTLQQHLATFQAATGAVIHVSNFCKAMWRLGFTRKRLQQYAAARDAHQAFLWRHSFKVRGYSVDMLLAVDETSKDMRATRRTFGYAIRGQKPIGRSGLLVRGQRVSALCSFDINGFVAHAFTEDTYDRPRFLRDAEKVILEHVRPFPQPRSIVLLDNASPHRCPEFVDAVNRRGGMVLFTPPYCWDLTPLDNGAFGYVKQWLKHRSDDIKQHNLTIQQALDRAFQAVGPEAARAFFKNCHMDEP